MTEHDVIRHIAEALGVAPDQVKKDSVAGDFLEWDSIGMLGLLTMVTREGLPFEPGDTESLQSVAGILGAFERAGKLDRAA